MSDNQDIIGIAICVYILLGFAHVAVEAFLYSLRGEDIDSVDGVSAFLLWPLLFFVVPYSLIVGSFSRLGRHVRNSKDNKGIGDD